MSIVFFSASIIFLIMLAESAGISATVKYRKKRL